MKKALLLAVVMMSMTMGAFAQGNSDGDQQLINKAKVAALQAGCLSDWNGQVRGDLEVVSSCFAGGFVTVVTIYPVCHGPECIYVKLGPLARVTFYCTDEVGMVECI
jgi:hypothetical protein